MISVPVVRGETKNHRRYLFEYRFDNAEWGLEIVAASAVEAQQRMEALAWANYRGEIALKIPIPGTGLMKRIKAALRPLYRAVVSSTRP